MHHVLHVGNYCYHPLYCSLFLPEAGSADKLHVKAAIILPLDGLARFKQDPIDLGRGAQNLYRPFASRGWRVSNSGENMAALCFWVVGRPGK